MRNAEKDAVDSEGEGRSVGKGPDRSLQQARSCLHYHGHIRQVTRPMERAHHAEPGSGDRAAAGRLITVVSCWLEGRRGQSLSGDIHNVLSQRITVFSTPLD